MTVASLLERLKVAPPTPPTPKKVEGQSENQIERLKAPAVTPVTPATTHGVTVKNSDNQLFLLEKFEAVTPVTPVTPKKVEGDNQNTELAHAAPVWVAPAPDPGMAQLLALAMAYCDRTGASPKARADWQADIEATPPGEREGLASYLRGQLAKLAPVAPAMPSTAAPTAPAKPVPKFSIEAPWRAADRTWLTHWQQCPQCQTAGRTGTARCNAGEALHQAYMEAIA